VRGLSYAGAIMAYEDTFKKKVYDSFSTFAGTSVGALFALICCLNVKTEDALDILDTIGLNEIFAKDFTWLLSNYALNSGACLNKVVTLLLGLRDLPADITMSQLHKFTRRSLSITAVNIKNASVLHITHLNCPDIKVISAIMGSMALPPLFPPVSVHWNDSELLLADGALIDNFPIGNFECDSTLGIRSSWYIEPTNPMADISTYYTRILGILQLSLHSMQSAQCSRYSNIVSIDLGPIKADNPDINVKEFIFKGYRSAIAKFTNEKDSIHEEISPTKYLL
jgi:predicted acylesterase/phospholipase RssA